MEAKKITELFEYIEKNTEIPSYEIQGWKAWGIIRYHLGLYLLTTDISKKNNINKRLLSLLKLKGVPPLLKYLNSIIHFFIILHTKTKHSDVIVRILSNARRDKIKGKYKCVHFDDIIENSKEINYYIMEELSAYKKHFSPAYNKVDFFSEGLDLYSIFKKINVKNDQINYIKERIIKELNLIKDGDKKQEIQEVISLIKRTFSIQIIYFIKRKETYKRLFKKINPKIFLMVCSYGSEALVGAARELNIKVIEMQHGLISQYHLGYNYGKHLLKYKNKFPIPNYLLTYSEYFTKLLLKHSFRDKSELITTGNSRIDYWQSSIKSNNNTIFNNIFITSQWAITDPLIVFLEKTLKLIKKKGMNVTITVKLHPREKASLKKWLKLKNKYKKNLIVIDGDALNLYKYILKSDFHASVYSSTHIESISLSKPTAILKLSGWEHVSDLVKENIAKLIKTPEEFIDTIIHSIKKDKFYKDWVDNTKKTSERYQEKNAIKKNISSIKKIMKTQY